MSVVAGPSTLRLWSLLAEPDDRFDRLLPHVREALIKREADIATGAAEPDAKALTPKNLLWRAMQTLYVKSLQDAALSDQTPMTSSRGLRRFRPRTSSSWVTIPTRNRSPLTTKGSSAP
jgi:hypothetical protein